MKVWLDGYRRESGDSDMDLVDAVWAVRDYLLSSGHQTLTVEIERSADQS